MPPRFNPFRPGSIVSPGMFAGRLDEIQKLEHALFQTKHGNPAHFIIQGERGIGKSSLLFYLNAVAQGQVTADNSVSFKFLTVDVELESSNSDLDILRKIAAQLRLALAGHNHLKAIAEKVWGFVKNLEVKGVRYHAEKADEQSDALAELTSALTATLNDLGDSFDGILILVDEADKPSRTANLGLTLKLLTERLTKCNAGRICFGLAGLPSVITTLRNSHESSPRIFTVLTLEPLSEPERKGVVRRGLEDAKQKNGFEVRITPEAEHWISAFSEGYPHFIQQFAFCAFDHDTDNTIDATDAMEGALRENGAFQQLGSKYFDEQYFDQIRSDQYRKVLQTMSDRGDNWVTKDILRAETKLKDSTLSNAVNALTKRRIIIPRKGVKGQYRLPTKAFAVWIRGYTQMAGDQMALGLEKEGSEKASGPSA
jgi:AAA ATPase domain